MLVEKNVLPTGKKKAGKTDYRTLYLGTKKERKRTYPRSPLRLTAHLLRAPSAAVRARRTGPATPVPNEVLFDPYPLPRSAAAARKNARAPSSPPQPARPPPLEQPSWPRVLPLLPLERNTTPGCRQSKRFLYRGRPRLVLVVFASFVPVDRRGEGIRPGVWIGFFSISIW